MFDRELIRSLASEEFVVEFVEQELTSALNGWDGVASWGTNWDGVSDISSAPRNWVWERIPLAESQEATPGFGRWSIRQHGGEANSGPRRSQPGAAEYELCASVPRQEFTFRHSHVTCGPASARHFLQPATIIPFAAVACNAAGIVADRRGVLGLASILRDQIRQYPPNFHDAT